MLETLVKTIPPKLKIDFFPAAKIAPKMKRILYNFFQSGNTVKEV